MRYIIITFCVTLSAIMKLDAAPRNVALVMSCQSYSGYPSGWDSLATPIADAVAITEVLEKQYHFDVIHVQDVTQKDIYNAFDDLKNRVNENDRILIYFAGHGHLDKQTDTGYWIPKDGARPQDKHDPKPSELRTWFSNDDLLVLLKKFQHAKHILVIADACFSGQLTRSNTRGLVEEWRQERLTFELRGPNPQKIQVYDSHLSRKVFASGLYDQEVMDGGGYGGHSPFAFYLLEALRNNTVSAMPARALFSRVIENLDRHPNLAQIANYGSIPALGDAQGEFVFWKTSSDSGLKLPTSEEVYFQRTIESHTIEAYKTFLYLFPNGKYSPIAEATLDSLRNVIVFEAYEDALKQNTPEAFRIFLKNYPESPYSRDGLKILEGLLAQQSDSSQISNPNIPSVVENTDDMIHIPAGNFSRGSISGDRDESPVRTIYLSDYYIDRFEVSVAKYRKEIKKRGQQMPPEPVWGWKDEHPIVNVTWQEAKKFCEWLGKRLPTEAEWEKAARGGFDVTYPWGNKSPDLNLSAFGSKPGGTVKVDAFSSGQSPYRVLNMAGNVWEWCLDAYDESFYQESIERNPKNLDYSLKLRVLRGGSWNTTFESLRVSNRHAGYFNRRFSDVGFRCVKD